MRTSTPGNGRTWQMTELDWFIVAFAVILALFGFRQGFIVGVLSFGGFALGAFLGTRLGPLLLPRVLLAVRARLRPDRRAARRRDPRERAGGPGLQTAPRAVPPGPGPARRPARRGARRGPRSGHRLDPRGRGGADAWPEAAARGHPALGDPARAQPAAAAVGPDPERARAAGPAASIAGPSPDVAAPQPAVARAAGRAERLAQRRARARHRLRPGDRGLGLGGAAGHGRDQRACRRRRAGHDRRGRVVSSPSLPARAIAFDPNRRHRGAARPRPRRAGPQPRFRNPSRAPPARSSAIPRTDPSTCSRAGSGARRP